MFLSWLRFALKRKDVTNKFGLKSSGNAFVSGAGGPRFKYRAGQIEHGVVNGLPPLQHFFKKSCVARRRNDTELGLANSLHVTATTASIMKDLIYHFCVI